MIAPSLCISLGNSNLYYPFGNTRVRNVLKDFSNNGFGNATKILFLGCGDLRNTLQATTAEHAQDFLIHLNDNNPSILARNILILKVLSDMNFNPNKEKDLSFLWDIWYNAEWPEVTKKRFLVVLNNLLDEKLPENVFIPDLNHFESLKKIWKKWHSVSSRIQPESELLLCKAKQERAESIVISNEFVIYPPRIFGEGITHEKAFARAVNEIIPNLMKRYMIEDLEDYAITIIEKEFQAFYEKGSCRLQNTLKPVCINPTFLNPDTEQWQVFYSSCPFRGYLPLSEKELITSAKGNILLPSCQKILQNMVASYRSRIATVQVFFHLEGALEFCFTNANKFDVIDCSNLADHVGLANLVNAANERLSNDPRAIFFVH